MSLLKHSAFVRKSGLILHRAVLSSSPKRQLNGGCQRHEYYNMHLSCDQPELHRASNLAALSKQEAELAGYSSSIAVFIGLITSEF